MRRASSRTSSQVFINFEEPSKAIAEEERPELEFNAAL